MFNATLSVMQFAHFGIIMWGIFITFIFFLGNITELKIKDKKAITTISNSEIFEKEENRKCNRKHTYLVIIFNLLISFAYLLWPNQNEVFGTIPSNLPISIHLFIYTSTIGIAMLIITGLIGACDIVYFFFES